MYKRARVWYTYSIGSRSFAISCRAYIGSSHWLLDTGTCSYMDHAHLGSCQLQRLVLPGRDHYQYWPCSVPATRSFTLFIIALCFISLVIFGLTAGMDRETYYYYTCYFDYYNYQVYYFAVSYSDWLKFITIIICSLILGYSCYMPSFETSCYYYQ